MRSTVVLATLLIGVSLPILPVTAQESDEEWLERCDRNGWDNDRRERFCEIREYGFRPSGSPIQIDAGHNGGIMVRGWNRDSVAVSARIQVEARTMDRAREAARAITIEAGQNGIRANRSDASSSTGWSVTFVVYVPHRTSLRAETYNGPIGVDEVTGDMTLRAHNGPLSLRNIGGDVRARTTNGPLTVDLEGKSWQGAGLDAETQNGPVDLTIPEGYSARLTTGTTNGPMRIGFPVTIQGRFDRRINTTLGEGGPPIRVITTNGPLVVRRG
ncbi:MAG TPA: hypothetical protein VJ672_12135 [Gemmatimonadaceae bacterium]|nr:hypothetical protein [Gemmatimonadaceae bacterium]